MDVKWSTETHVVASFNFYFILFMDLQQLDANEEYCFI